MSDKERLCEKCGKKLRRVICRPLDEPIPQYLPCLDCEPKGGNSMIIDPKDADKLFKAVPDFPPEPDAAEFVANLKGSLSKYDPEERVTFEQALDLFAQLLAKLACSKLSNKAFRGDVKLLEKQNTQLRAEIERYGETAKIFKWVSDLYYAFENTNQEPALSATKALIRDGERALQLQESRRKDECIKQLQKQVEELTEYAWHLSDCAKIDLPKRAKIDMQCTCGLEQAQKQ